MRLRRRMGFRRALDVDLFARKVPVHAVGVAVSLLTQQAVAHRSIGISNALGKAWGGHGTRVRARMRRLRPHGVSGLGADALAWVGFGRPVTLHKGGSLPRPRG